jgi:hypothetical protein
MNTYAATLIRQASIIASNPIVQLVALLLASLATGALIAVCWIAIS